MVSEALQPLEFGGGERKGGEFWAGYACDASGKRYLELRTFEGRVGFFSLRGFCF